MTTIYEKRIQYMSAALPRRIKCFMFSTKPAKTRQHSELIHGCSITCLTSFALSLMQLLKWHWIWLCELPRWLKFFQFSVSPQNSSAFVSWVSLIHGWPVLLAHLSSISAGSATMHNKLYVCYITRKQSLLLSKSNQNPIRTWCWLIWCLWN